MAKLTFFCQRITVAACLMLPVFAHAQTDSNQTNPNQAVTDMIRLQHRGPDSIRIAIEPQLDPRGAINQFDNTLVISTSRANLMTLRQMIDELDIPLRQVRINVDFAYGQPLPPAAPTETAPDETAEVEEAADSGDATDTPPSTQPSPRQSIVVTEGEAVWFQNMLQPLPLPSLNDYQPEQASGSPEDNLGFAASVELRDNRVILRTAMPQGDSAAVANNLQDRLLSSTIELEPGQWFVLNAAPEDDALISGADSGDFNDFASASSSVDSSTRVNSGDTRSTPAASDSGQDLMAIQVELL